MLGSRSPSTMAIQERIPTLERDLEGQRKGPLVCSSDDPPSLSLSLTVNNNTVCPTDVL